jgi:hypothetical protein
MQHTATELTRFRFPITPVVYYVVTNVMATGTFPAAPTVANLASAQDIDSSSDFTLQWNAFTGASANDLIIFSVQNAFRTVYQTSLIPGGPNALNGLATSALIPEGTLKAGCSYFCRLIFATVQSTVSNQLANALGATLYESETDFYIRTQGAGDTTTPSLVSSIPTTGATVIPTNTPVVFSFNRPMNASWSISMTGVGLSSYSGGWNPDNTRFGLTPSPAFYANYTHNTVVLNPVSQPLLFADTNGNLLPPDTVVTFTTGSGIYQSQTPTLLNPRLGAAGTVQVDLEGSTNNQCILQCSTNLVDWFSLVTNAVFDGTVNFTDTNAAAPNRFYREVSD